MFVDDFSFEGSSTSASGSRSPSGGVEGEALSVAVAGVDPKDAILSPVDTGVVDPVAPTSTSMSSLHSALYSDSGSPDMAHFEHQHQRYHHQSHHHDRLEDYLGWTICLM